jgi:hypothetical protein
VISGTIRSCCVVGANADVIGVVNGEKDFIGSRKALLIVLAKSLLIVLACIHYKIKHKSKTQKRKNEAKNSL